MRIAILGKGNVGAGLAARWQRAGHTVTALGSDGGDVSDADVVVVAVPSVAIADALRKANGVEGKVVIDATNALDGRSDQFESLAQEIQAIVGGPVAKSFNSNFAALYNEIDDQRVSPSNLFAADDDARAVTERLVRDAGYHPVYVGGLDKARLLEDHIRLVFAINEAGLGPFFYRIAQPGNL